MDLAAESLPLVSILEANNEVLRSIESARAEVTSFSGRPMAKRFGSTSCTTVKSVGFLQ